MPNNALLPLIGCALVLSAMGADYGLGRMDVPKSHRLPVETFPDTIGSWKGGPLELVNEDVQRKLPTAKIVERVYTNPVGQQVDLMLLTATEDEDMHSPQACFPSQGWKLSNIHDTQVDGQPGTQMNGQINGQAPEIILYWMTGYFPAAAPQNALLRKAFVWRTQSFDKHNNMSLFVRILSPDTPLGRRNLSEFTALLHTPIKTLIGSGTMPTSKTLFRRQI